jgi:peptidoglycan/xylan/chitin deacetylase (PgdA/CDA1 family)
MRYLRMAVIPLMAGALALAVPATSSAAPQAHALPAAASQATIAATLPPYSSSTCGVISGHHAMLSIDDYPYGATSRFTTVPATLKTYNVGMVTFLLVQPFYPSNGATAESRAKARVTALRATGMYVANHTYDHKSLTSLSVAGIEWELRNGVKANMVRPPGGAHNATVDHLIGSGYYHARECIWNVDLLDWKKYLGSDGKYHYPTASMLISRFKTALKNAGGKALMVLGHWHTNYPLALPYLKSAAAGVGYTLCRRYPGTTTTVLPYPLYC